MPRTSQLIRHEPVDRGDILASWFIKIAVTTTLVAFIGFDATSVFTTKFAISDTGAQAARDASENFRSTASRDQALKAAIQTATQDNSKNIIDPKSFSISKEGTVSLKISREAKSVLIHRISPIRKWSTVTVTTSGRTPL